MSEDKSAIDARKTFTKGSPSAALLQIVYDSGETGITYAKSKVCRYNNSNGIIEELSRYF